MVTELAFAPSFLSFSALSRLHAILTACFLSKLVASYTFAGCLLVPSNFLQGETKLGGALAAA
jgi:hypothetical protein